MDTSTVFKKVYREGYFEALTKFAVWWNGVEHVGCGNLTLQQAKEELDARLMIPSAPVARELVKVSTEELVNLMQAVELLDGRHLTEEQIHEELTSLGFDVQGSKNQRYPVTVNTAFLLVQLLKAAREASGETHAYTATL